MQKKHRHVLVRFDDNFIFPVAVTFLDHPVFRPKVAELFYTSAIAGG